VSLKVPIKHVQELMGQRDWESTARYIHPADRELFVALDLITDDSIPEYLLNKSYILAILSDDGESAVTVVDAPQPKTQEVGWEATVKTPGEQAQLPPRLLSKILVRSFTSVSGPSQPPKCQRNMGDPTLRWPKPVASEIFRCPD
jgi:hypothetical protein